MGAYSDATSAKDDFEFLRALQGPDFAVEAAVVMSRDADGKVDVLTKGTGVTGAGIGAVLGHLVKRHEEKELGVDLDEYLPPNSCAVVVVIDNKYLDRVEKALTKADKRITKAIDADDAIDA